VLLVGLDDRVRFQFGGPGSRRRLAHDQNLAPPELQNVNRLCCWRAD
jgi:hypothetical protein